MDDRLVDRLRSWHRSFWSITAVSNGPDHLVLCNWSVETRSISAAETLSQVAP